MSEMKKSKLDVLFAELVEKATQCAKAQNDGSTATEIREAKKAAAGALSAYNAEAATVAYKAWASEGNPVMRAIDALTIPGTKRVSYKPDKISGEIRAEISDAETRISLPQMHKELGADVFASGDWFNRVQKMAFLIANALNKDLGDNANFNYEIKEAAKAFEFAADANPTSNKSVVKALQCVVDGILFIPAEKNGKPVVDKAGKPVNELNVCAKQWTFVRESMTKRGGVPGQVVVCNTAQMSDLIVDVIHMIIKHKDVSLAVSA